MSLRKLDVICPNPGCGKPHEVEVEVTDPPAREIIKEVVREDAARVSDLTRQLEEAERSADALQAELRRWQSGENHLTVQDMLNMLQNCPNCRPVLESFVLEQQREAIAGLSPDQVRQIARAQRWWPPPTIHLGVKRRS